MANIYTDLSVRHARRAPQTGLQVRGRIRVEPTTIYERIGEPDAFDTTGVGEWIVDCPVGRMRLSRATGYVASYEGLWDVSARTDAVLPWLYRVLAGTTVDFPSAVAEFFGSSSLASLTSTYRDYAFMRGRGADDALTALALELRQRLFDYEWTRPTREERAVVAAAIGASRPGDEPLCNWLEEGRRLIEGRREAPSHVSDLPHALLGLADEYQAAEVDVEGLGGESLKLHRELEGTLRALATTRIPRRERLNPSRFD